jgi:hypothetical protein
MFTRALVFMVEHLKGGARPRLSQHAVQDCACLLAPASSPACSCRHPRPRAESFRADRSRASCNLLRSCASALVRVRHLREPLATTRPALAQGVARCTRSPNVRSAISSAAFSAAAVRLHRERCTSCRVVQRLGPIEAPRTSLARFGHCSACLAASGLRRAPSAPRGLSRRLISAASNDTPRLPHRRRPSAASIPPDVRARSILGARSSSALIVPRSSSRAPVGNLRWP